MTSAFPRFRTVVLLALCLLAAGFAGLRAEEPWRFVVVSDTQGGDKGINLGIVQELTAAILEEHPAFVLVSGDLVMGNGDRKAMGQQLAFWRQNFMAPLMEQGIKVYPVRGNHNRPDDDSGAQPWLDVFGKDSHIPDNGPANARKLDYSFVYRNAVVIGLDMYIPGREHAVDQAWFERQLALRPGSHIFVFAHEPAFALGPDGHADGMSLKPEARDRFAESLVNAGGLTYFCGHDHWYDRTLVEMSSRPPKYLFQVTVGTGGASIRKWSGTYRDSRMRRGAHYENHGYLVVTVDGPRARCVMMGRTGPDMFSPVDTFTCRLPAR